LKECAIRSFFKSTFNFTEIIFVIEVVIINKIEYWLSVLLVDMSMGTILAIIAWKSVSGLMKAIYNRYGRLYFLKIAEKFRNGPLGKRFFTTDKAENT